MEVTKNVNLRQDSLSYKYHRWWSPGAAFFNKDYFSFYQRKVITWSVKREMKLRIQSQSLRIDVITYVG